MKAFHNSPLINDNYLQRLQALSNIEAKIIERLPDEQAKEFEIQFSSAINVGADLSDVWNYFAIWLLTDAEHGVVNFAKNKKIVQDIADAYLDDITTPVTAERWAKLRKNAYAAYHDAYDAYSAYHTSDADAEYAIAATTDTDAAAAYASYAAASTYAAYASASSFNAIAVDKNYAAAFATDYAYAAYANANEVNDSTYDGIEWFTAASQKLIELLKEAN